MKKIRLLSLIMCFMLLFLSAEAKRVNVERAEKIARSYARVTPRLTSRRDFSLSRTVSKPVERKRPATRSAAQQQDEPMFYVFTMNGNGGFIIVSGDDVAKPVLGYSDEGTYDENNPNLAYWMETLSQEIAGAIENSVPQDEQTRAAWEAFESNSNTYAQSLGDYVEPLIKTKWNQEEPYNDLCPPLSGTRTATGCVATAMAQIMKYHEYPTERTVTIPGYKTETGITIPKISGSTVYRWNEMSNIYTSSSSSASCSAVAELMYHCGVSVEMNYDISGSGAYSHDVVNALKTIFGYDAGITYHDRYYYSYTEWTDLLRAEIKANRPVYYGGNSETVGGHSFVCDGYNADGLFHFNWGWGGNSDGYFEVSALNPNSVGVGGGSGGYNQYQDIITGIQPDSGGQPAIQLVLSTFSANKTSLGSLTESFSVKAGSLANIGNITINSVYLGVLLYRQDDSYHSYKTERKTLGLPSWSFYIDPYTLLSSYTLPSGLPAGTYKLYPAYSATSEIPSIIPGENGNPYIAVVVGSDGKVTLSKSSAMPDLSMGLLKSVYNVYKNRTGNFTAEITNSGTADYNSVLKLRLGAQTVATDPVVIPAGTTKTVGFSDIITLSPGNYQLSVWYDPNNAPDGTPSVQLGNSVSIEVKAEPTESPNLSLASTPSFKNGSNAVPQNAPSLTVKVKNTGGVYDGVIDVVIFPEDGGNSIGSFGMANVWIEKNETKTILLNNPIDFLTVGTRYRYRIYDGQQAVGDRYYFTVAAPVTTPDAQTPTLTVHPQSAVYTVGETAAALSVTATVTDGGTLSYQWYRNTGNSNTGGTAVSGATAASYTPPTDAVGTVYYYVEVTNTLAGSRPATAKSNTSAITVKRTQTNAPESPTLAGKTATSITLNTISGDVEYRRDGTAWQDSPTFNGLTPNTAYIFYARYKETGTQVASESSNPSIPITTDKATLSGTVTVSGTATFGETLTAVTSALTSTPVINSLGTLSYKWKRNGTDISGATASTLTLVQADIAAKISVTVTAANTQGSLTSTATAAVAKAAQSAPDAPTVAGKNVESVTLNTIPGNVEYSKDGTAWQDSPRFDGLTQNTVYIFYARYKETGTQAASESSKPSEPITTDRATLSGTVTVSGTAAFGNTLTAVTSALTSVPVINSLGTFSYQWKRNGTDINGATASTLTLVKADITAKISVTVTAANAQGSRTSIATAAVTKAAQTAPDMPTVAEKTVESVTLNTIPGNVEYSKGGTIWQDSPRFDGLTPNTAYIFHAKLKETDTHSASPASMASVTTYAGEEAELFSLSINGEPVSVSDKESEYQAKCGENSIRLNTEISVAADASVTVNDVEYSIDAPIPLSEDATTTVNIQISGNYSKSGNYKLTIRNPLDADIVLFQRWHNVLAVNGNRKYTGYDIKGVRWYRQGSSEVLSSERFIKITGMAEDYSAEVNIAGKWHHVCGSPKTKDVEKIIAYPNPVSVGDNLNLQLPDGFIGGYIDVINLSGSTVKQKLPVAGRFGALSVADWSPGIYLLNIVGPDGDRETVKIIVSN
jgi:hypothetical protein